MRRKVNRNETGNESQGCGRLMRRTMKARAIARCSSKKVLMMESLWEQIPQEYGHGPGGDGPQRWAIGC